MFQLFHYSIFNILTKTFGVKGDGQQNIKLTNTELQTQSHRYKSNQDYMLT